MSAPATLRAISQAVLAAALLAATAWLCFRAGGYFHDPRSGLAIAAWVAVAAVALVPASGTVALVPPTRAGRLAVAGLLGLAAWTAISVAWAPLREAALEDVWRLALYAAFLPLAVAALRDGGPARAVEPALVALATVVVGYGLLAKAGAIDATASAGADGRLDQPLSYWNAMGALAAAALVLAARLATDRGRPRGLRAAGAVALLPLAAGLFLTYSRGAVAAAAVGLVVLALVAPEARTLWRRAGRGWRLAAGWGTVAVAVAATAFVAADRAAPEPARGATVERFADVGSNRADYWDVALGAFAAAPVGGLGTAGFRVEWLRERDVLEGAVDAHSLYVETAAELGLVGLALLAAFAAGIALCLWRAVRGGGPDAALVAGPCAALAALALHYGIDWDWELPALTLYGLLLAAVAVSR
ncbi:MAG: hypothetical protein GXY03_08565 [Solirubrobacterales bacterium]|nr:hypothetical protein [Solirubrobacterales bacterium]